LVTSRPPFLGAQGRELLVHDVREQQHLVCSQHLVCPRCKEGRARPAHKHLLVCSGVLAGSRIAGSWREFARARSPGCRCAEPSGSWVLHEERPCFMCVAQCAVGQKMRGPDPEQRPCRAQRPRARRTRRRNRSTGCSARAWRPAGRRGSANGSPSWWSRQWAQRRAVARRKRRKPQRPVRKWNECLLRSRIPPKRIPAERRAHAAGASTQGRRRGEARRRWWRRARGAAGARRRGDGRPPRRAAR